MYGSSWTDGGFALFYFHENGDLQLLHANGTYEFPGFNLLQWHDFKIDVGKPGDGNYHFDYWVNGTYLGHFLVQDTFSMTPTHLMIGGAAGTSWFDDVCVSQSAQSPWCDDFEDYSGSDWSTYWHGSGNSSSVLLDNSIVYEGSQSIYMFGVLGGCWGTVLTRPLATTYPMTIDVAVRNGSEPVSGCHAFRSDLILRPGPDWWDAGLPLFMFLANGDLRITFAQPEIDMTGYSLEQWYKIKVALYVPGDGLLHARFTVDGNFLGEYTRPWESWMANDQYVAIQVEEGSAWFDDVCVTPGIDNSNLVIPSMTVLPCDGQQFVQPVQLDLAQEITAFGVPLKLPSGVTVDSIGRSDAIQGWSQFDYVVKTDSGFLQVLASSGMSDPLSVGLTTVFNVYCSFARICNADQVVHWDTALSGDSGRRLQVSDIAYNTSYPDFEQLADSSTIKGFIPGDINSSGGAIPVDLSDLSMMVAYMTGVMPPSSLCIKTAADVTGNGIIDVSDLSMLVAYLCGLPVTLKCSTMPPAPKVNAVEDIVIAASTDNGLTRIALTSNVDLSAIQLAVSGAHGLPLNLKSGELDLLQGSADGVTNLILIDLKGKNFIKSGSQTLLEIPGQVEIVSATVSDMEFQSWSPVINGTAKPGNIPTSYSLSQNYPNPFNPSTNISFSLPVASNYTLAIYNVNGQLVEEFTGHSEAGTVSLAWDGARMASGVYLYRLSAGDFTETKKMMLLK